MANDKKLKMGAELDYMALEVAQHHNKDGFEDALAHEGLDDIEIEADQSDGGLDDMDYDGSQFDSSVSIESDEELLEVIQRLTETVADNTDDLSQPENLTTDYSQQEVSTQQMHDAENAELLETEFGAEESNFTAMEISGEFDADPGLVEYAGIFSDISVGNRIAMLIAIPLFALMGLGAYSIYTLDQNRTALEDIRVLAQEGASNHKLTADLGESFIAPMNQALFGAITFGAAADKLDSFKVRLIEEYIPIHLNQSELVKIPAAIDEAVALLNDQDRAGLELYVLNDLAPFLEPITEGLNEEVALDAQITANTIAGSQANARIFLTLVAVFAVLGSIFSFILGNSIYRSISTPIANLSNIIKKIAGGDDQARAELIGENELTALGESLNVMADERIAAQNKVAIENEEINDSVFGLLEAVAELAERNLTVRATVTEDATGPIADAVNELAEETGRVLKQVRKIAASVEAASQLVNRSALSVTKLSEEEQREAQATADQLETIVQRLDSVAQSAGQANKLADITSNATENAQKTVANTLENMIDIRTNVQETGKRLKRLGERSQEISQIIDVINNLSERTTVLALNASMQAASAGEAGRGFSIIAEEIQRLSENSRESTDRISTLVSNIQQEANATITNMDATIEQVLDGSTLAEDAAQQMRATLDATTRLVASVEQIAKSSAEQVDISKGLQVRAERIIESTQSTGRELSSLTSLTKKMAEYGKQLVKSVNVFKLEA